MTTLPPALRVALQEALGHEIGQATPLSGGMINRVAWIETLGGPVFVKWKENAPPGFFAAEAEGLSRLRSAGKLRVPRVLAFHDREQGVGRWALGVGEKPIEETGNREQGTEPITQLPNYPITQLPNTQDEPPSFLALEYIPPRPPLHPARFAERFGAALAAQHREALSPNGDFGLEQDNYIGILTQDNTFHSDWATFYRERRLLPQMALARRRGLLPPERERLLMRVIADLDSLLVYLPARPALLHGDLWNGNVLAVDDDPVVLDPAVYYGEREMEIAYMELFDGFPPRFLSAYTEAFPLDPGYEYRRHLHQLYPLLVHLNHFGEAYGPDVDSACCFYVP